MSVFSADVMKNYSIEIKLRNATDNATAYNMTQVIIQTEPRPKYWFYMARGYNWIFFSVDNVLKKLGLEKIEIKVNNREPVHLDWNLLWSYDYHNEIPMDFQKLSYHQKINHIPGNFVMCMKDILTCNTDSKYLPKAFNNTGSLREYAEKNPNKRFVQKLWSNRGVELKKFDEINFEVFGPGIAQTF